MFPKIVMPRDKSKTNKLSRSYTSKTSPMDKASSGMDEAGAFLPSGSPTAQAGMVADIMHSLFSSSEFMTLLQAHIDKSLAKFSKAIDINTGDIHDLNVRQDSNDEKLQKMASELNSLRDANVDYAMKVNDLEQYTRRNSLRVYGIPSTDDEDTTDTLLELFRNKLQVTLSTDDIDRSHRIGKPVDGKSRALIVKFVRHDDQNRVLRARRKLKGSKVVIKEDLTATNLKLLSATASHDEVDKAWSWDGRIFCKKTDDSGRIFPIRSKLDIAKLTTVADENVT